MKDKKERRTCKHIRKREEIEPTERITNGKEKKKEAGRREREDICKRSKNRQKFCSAKAK